MGGIFGGSKSREQSTTENQAFPFLQQQLGGAVGSVGSSVDLISGLLGGDRSALDQFANSAGLDFVLDQGGRGITQSGAARGLLRSGATGRALTNFGQQTSKSFLNDYINQAMGLGQLGLGAAGTIAQAGQRSESSGSSRKKPGLGGLIGGVASGVASSDRRLKYDIEPIGKLEDGVTIYKFKYVDHIPIEHTGVIAQEIAETRPELVSSDDQGFLAVDYTDLGKEIRNALAI